MKSKGLWSAPLASLFSSLLSGCFLPGETYCTKVHTFTRDLTPEEYAQWSKGMPTESTWGDPTTSGASATSDATAGGSSTGGSSTGGSSTGGSSTGGSSTGGELLTEQEICTMVCEHYYGWLKSCGVEENADKVVITCEATDGCVDGRRHACVTPRRATRGPEPVAAWLAHAAHDEAASVQAFRALGRELAVHGAPPELLAQIEAAASDEVRHAAVVSALARRRGAAVPEPQVVEMPVRALLAIAVENVVEGCVHETWAALRAAHQALHATDPAVRGIYTRIAADEARHAELAWAIDAWLSSQLDAEGRNQVALARGAAVQALAGELTRTPDTRQLAVLGLPPARVASRLCAGLDDALWSRAA